MFLLLSKWKTQEMVQTTCTLRHIYSQNPTIPPDMLGGQPKQNNSSLQLSSADDYRSCEIDKSTHYSFTLCHFVHKHFKP